MTSGCRTVRPPTFESLRPARRWVVVVVTVALAAGLAACQSDTSASASASGDLDADVVGGDGRVLGTLHGSVDGSKGFVVFTPEGGGMSPGVLSLDVTSKGGGSWHLSGAGAGDTRLDLRLRGRRLEGTGKAPGGATVSIVGYGGVERADTGRGRLLQLGRGKLPDEVAASLGANYRLEGVDVDAFSRERVLAHPELLDGVAGVMISTDISPQTLRGNGLLRAFGNGHRWVVVAGASDPRLEALRGILPVTRLPEDRPAVAVRRSGVPGGSDALRSVVIYPSPPVPEVAVHRGDTAINERVMIPAETEQRLRANRISFFADELARRGAPYAQPGTGRFGPVEAAPAAAGAAEGAEPGAHRSGDAAFARSALATRAPIVAQAGGGGSQTADCTQAQQPAVSGAQIYSCYQVDVAGQTTMVMPGAGNIGAFCLYDGANKGSAYCPASPEFEALAGGPPLGVSSIPGAPPDNVASAAQFAAVCPQAGKGRQYYTLIAPYFMGAFAGFVNMSDASAQQIPSGLDASYNDCPAYGSQTATYSITDTYFAIYEPISEQQAVMALVYGTITPNDGSSGGPTFTNENGGWNQPLRACCTALPETGFVLGEVETVASYTPPASASGQQVFDYQGDSSFPEQQITNSQVSTTESHTQGFQIGASIARALGGDGSGTGTGSFQWTDQTTWSTETTVNVPDWTVVPNNSTLPGGGSSVSYVWQTNTPNTWNTFQCWNENGCKVAFGTSSLNGLNTNSWSPASQTAWGGDQTGGSPVLSTVHTFGFSDHFTNFTTGDPSYEWLVPVDLMQYVNFSDTTTSDYTSEFGAQELDLCDPLVTGNGHFPLCAIPTVAGVSPASGPQAGGSLVVVTGTGFTSASTVEFGANPSPSFTIKSDSQITATAPAGTAGTVDVTVSGPGGTSPTSAVDGYTYAAGP